MSTTVASMFVLTSAHRCDRCGAPARVSAVTQTGGVLLFCGHHSNKHAPVLKEQGALLYKGDGSPLF